MRLKAFIASVVFACGLGLAAPAVNAAEAPKETSAAVEGGALLEMQRRGGGMRGFRGGGMRAAGFRGGPRFGGGRFVGVGPRVGFRPGFSAGPRIGYGPRPGWRRAGWGPRRYWGGPVIVGAPLIVGAGIVATRPAWAGPNCRRVLRVNRFGEEFWATRCCRVEVRPDGLGGVLRTRVCRRVA